MEITIIRQHYGDNCTTGELAVDGVYFCAVLEPHYDAALATEAGSGKAIAPGRYRLVTGHSMRYHRLMPYLCDVPGRTAIMIHPGNTAADSRGCILVGTLVNEERIGNSRQTFGELYRLIARCYARGEEIWVEYV